MDVQVKRIKQLLLMGAVYFRIEELGQDPSDPEARPDLVRGEQGEPTGYQVWINDVAKYLGSRYVDSSGWGSPESGFLMDLAVLMAEIETPQRIFQGNAKQTMIALASRMASVEGWQILAGQSEIWRGKIESVDACQDAKARANTYLQLFREHWCYQMQLEAIEDVFDSVFAWASEAGQGFRTSTAYLRGEKGFAGGEDLLRIDAEELLARRSAIRDNEKDLLDETAGQRGCVALELEGQGSEATPEAFDRLVEELVNERSGQARRLQRVLNAYLRQWDQEQQHLTREQKGRPADEIAQAKKELVGHVNAALERLDISICYNGKPCNLIFYVGESNRRGLFWLTPKGETKPVRQKANLSDVFDLLTGEPNLAVSNPRREGFSTYREREKSRRKSNQPKDLGS